MKLILTFLLLSLQAATIHASTLNAQHVGRYNSEAGFEKGGCEIVDFDPTTKRAFTTNGLLKTVDIIDISDIGAMTLYKRIDVNDFELGSFVAGKVNSISVCEDSMLVAISVEAEIKQDNGKIIVIDMEGNLKYVFDAGALPDMVLFSKDGKHILSANEGEPNDDYSIDPEGSVTIIDMDDKTTHQVSFVGQESKVKGKIHRNKNAAFANDLEPEYITLSSDYSTAYVSLQENNAIAVIDIATKTVTSIKSLGYVDHSVAGNELDASDKDGVINIVNMPLLGLYQPDGICKITINGVNYILTANEGDARDYKTYTDKGKWDDIDDIQLDASNYKGYTQSELDSLVANGLFDNDQLGRKKLIITEGINEDGKTTALYSFGTRSFSIRKASDLSLVYNSGSAFERYIADKMPKTFNTTNTKLKFDNRSDNRGPEPESVTTGVVNDVPYAFIGLERHGGIMVYNLSDPNNPVFEQYILSRDFSDDTKYNEGDSIDNDMSPEGLCFISPENSPTGKALLLAGFEVSGTMSAYELSFSDNTPIIGSEEKNNNYFARLITIFPNPAVDIINISPSIDGIYEIYGSNSKKIATFIGTSYNVSTFTKGIYYIVIRNNNREIKAIDSFYKQ